MKLQSNEVNRSVPTFLNIACGGTYLAAPEWENIDYMPDEDGHVRRMNVLDKLEPSQAEYEAVYCSHFVEHIPSEGLLKFLERCRALTAPNGLLRIVVPDAEFLLREYLKHKDAGDDARAEFAFVNFLDQCVRRKRGGRLGSLYGEIARGKRPDLEEYAIYLNGAMELGAMASTPVAAKTRFLRLLKSPRQFVSTVENRITRFTCRLLPRGFRSQNVSYADVGEMHHWMYDFTQLSKLLKEAGFSEVSRMSHDTSRRSDGVFLPLDMHNGAPRKGHHQLFIEAYP